MAGWRICVLVCVVASIPLASPVRVPPSEQPRVDRQGSSEQPVPKAERPDPVIVLASTGTPRGPVPIRLHLDGVRIIRATVNSATALKPLYADVVGHSVGLVQVRGLTQKITAKCGNDGYVLSSAVVPPQGLRRRRAITARKQAAVPAVVLALRLAAHRDDVLAADSHCTGKHTMKAGETTFVSDEGAVGKSASET